MTSGRKREAGRGVSMDIETAACEIMRLPEDLLATIISLTSPPDACHAAAVSRAFLRAAESDAVWSNFLPRDLPIFAEGELAHAPSSMKALFRCHSDQPALLPCKRMVRTTSPDHPTELLGKTPVQLAAHLLSHSHRRRWKEEHSGHKFFRAQTPCRTNDASTSRC